MSATTPALAQVYEARHTIAPHVSRTPVVTSRALSRHAGVPVKLKLETVQETGSFKLRGATNALLHLSEEDRARGVVAVSTGNHGRAVAHAAARFGVTAVVCASARVPQNKIDAIKDAGAEVRVVGESQDEAQEEADVLVEGGMAQVHPFDSADVIAGQGTIGIELLEDLPHLGTAVVPLSGGGLISGIALVLKAASKSIRVVGVSMERGAAMVESQRAGKPVPVEEEDSLADSLAGGIGLDNRHTFQLVRDFVDDMVLVSEDQIAGAMRFLYQEEALVVEGGGAVGVAALLGGQVPAGDGPVAVVLSGRNVDMGTFSRVVETATAGSD